MAGQTLPEAVKETPRGDLGRRIALRRTQLGLTREETAQRARMPGSYVRHLEEHPQAAPGTGALRRLAAALETTTAELTGATAGRPPGQGGAGRDAGLTVLDAEECRALLGAGGVGRLALLAVDGITVVPVNYSVVDGAVVFRTDPRATPARAAGRRVAFEVDRVDDAFATGWSVLVRGTARAVTDPAEARRLAARAYGEPWAGGLRPLWIRLDPTTLTGRRVPA
ncbi:helix-turn-helix domain-containing protein [Streptomyces griseosporeus]|uniref:helix-turn-helix domain-containing protein n=1 Tax=Streptomyces griseosporeus TaxID=1910 RepID=UPI0036FEDD46